MDRWWLVLDRIGERVVYRTPSWTDAFRVARRRSGGRASLRQGPEFGVTVVGRLGACTVITIVGKARRAGPRAASAPPQVPGGSHGTAPRGRGADGMPAGFAASV